MYRLRVECVVCRPVVELGRTQAVRHSLHAVHDGAREVVGGVHLVLVSEKSGGKEENLFKTFLR